MTEYDWKKYHFHCIHIHLASRVNLSDFSLQSICFVKAGSDLTLRMRKLAFKSIVWQVMKKKRFQMLHVDKLWFNFSQTCMYLSVFFDNMCNTHWIFCLVFVRNIILFENEEAILYVNFVNYLYRLSALERFISLIWRISVFLMTMRIVWVLWRLDWPVMLLWYKG